MRRVLASLLLCTLAAACTPDSVDPIGASADLDSDGGALLAGPNASIEYHQGDAGERQLADATALTQYPTQIRWDGSEWYRDDPWANGDTLADAWPVCGGDGPHPMPFSTQQAMYSRCGGTLVGPDLVVTNTQCVQFPAGNTFVFGFRLDSPTSLNETFSADDVYIPMEIVSWELSATADYALWRLHRPVVGLSPVSVRTSGGPTNGDSLTVMANPYGLPTRIADPTTVTDASRPQSFDLDATGYGYGGLSGAAVFDTTTGLMEGVVGYSPDDFSYDIGCLRGDSCADGSCTNTQLVTRTTEFADNLEFCDGDGIDNDNDGAIDCADSDCTNARVCNPPVCDFSDTVSNRNRNDYHPIGQRWGSFFIAADMTWDNPSANLDLHLQYFDTNRNKWRNAAVSATSSGSDASENVEFIVPEDSVMTGADYRWRVRRRSGTATWCIDPLG